MNFDVDLFEELISDPAEGGRGRPFTWEKAQRCPCLTPRNRSAVEDCVLCSGFGWFYSAQTPDAGDTFFGAALSIMGDRKYSKFGEWLLGDMALTFPAGLLISDMDRITLTDGFYEESDLLTRGSKDKLLDRGAYQVQACRDLAREYQSGLDFGLVDGEIVWVGQQPAEGATYSVSYLARPVYVVWLKLPQDRTHVPTVLGDGSVVDKVMPRKVALRRWIDFVRGTNAN